MTHARFAFARAGLLVLLGSNAAAVAASTGAVVGQTASQAATTRPTEGAASRLAQGAETEALLVAGRLGEAQARLSKLRAGMAAGTLEEQQARFEAGVVRFLRGVEGLGQALYRYSPRTQAMWILGLPATRLPLPTKTDPDRISYDDFREVLEGWNTSLRESAELLAGLGEAEVKFTLRFGLVRLDFDGDGRGSENESLWRIYAALNRGAGLDEQNAADSVISFDRADAEWLRGYCHLLMAMNDFALAYDFRELFERAGHIFFPRIVSPYEFLGRSSGGAGTFDYESIVDLIAYVHLLNFEVKAPERLTACLEHLQSMVQASRRMWKFALAERDADREWIPNPHQTGVIPNIQVSQEQLDRWMEFLDEVDALLEGRKLLPFWRNAGGKGVNLKRVFTEPRRFDLVLWVQGTAATPYLEDGTVTRQEFWERLQRTFGGNFIGFAIWWN